MLSNTALGDTLRIRKLPVNYYEQRALDRLDRQRADSAESINRAEAIQHDNPQEREKREADEKVYKQRKLELLKSFRNDADAIQAAALKRLEKESRTNQSWIKAKATGHKPLAPIAARDAKRMLELDEVKAWISSEVRYAKIEKRLNVKP